MSNVEIKFSFDKKMNTKEQDFEAFEAVLGTVCLKGFSEVYSDPFEPAWEPGPFIALDPNNPLDIFCCSITGQLLDDKTVNKLLAYLKHFQKVKRIILVD